MDNYISVQFRLAVAAGKPTKSEIPGHFQA